MDLKVANLSSLTWKQRASRRRNLSTGAKTASRAMTKMNLS
tara:strand:+ start:477 stop:599 length:123 start_codon:yes stop_codon:yes gene_type:complete